MPRPRRGIVLGAGGVLGAAWTIGALSALEEVEGFDVRDADVIIGTSAGNDLYHPIQALIIAAIIVVIIYKLHYWVERRFKIDDAVGAVAVHGYTGFLGVFIAGFVLWGYPSSPDALLGHEAPWAVITPFSTR